MISAPVMNFVLVMIRNLTSSATSIGRPGMAVADELLDVLKLWRQETQFSGEDDWMFASPVKLGRLPLSYSHVWATLDRASERAGIGHVSSQ